MCVVFDLIFFIYEKLASLRDPSRCAAQRAVRTRDTRYTRVAGLAARGGLAAAPPPQLTRYATPC